MAKSMKGLQVKPTHVYLIGVAFSNGLEQIKFPNRGANILCDGFFLSQLDGEVMRAMEQQQQRHMKEVYIDSALKSLASNLGNGSFSKPPFKNAYTQDTKSQRIPEMLTRARNLRKANAKNDDTEYYDLDREAQHELESSASSSDGQVDVANHIHVEDQFGSVRDIKNDYMLKSLEAERRMQEISGNDKRMVKAKLHKIRVQVRYRICNNKMLSMICSLRRPRYNHLILCLATKGQNLYFLQILY